MWPFSIVKQIWVFPSKAYCVCSAFVGFTYTKAYNSVGKVFSTSVSNLKILQKDVSLYLLKQP